MTSVEITTPDGTQRVALRAEAITIGRGATNDVALPYSHISRLHAELRFHQGAWWVRDQGSTNGLRVNGQRVLEARLDPTVVVELSPHVSLRLLSEVEVSQLPATPSHATSATVAPPEAPPEITPLSAYAPRSPYAEDETPYYPKMRPKVPQSRPGPTAPASPPLPRPHTRESQPESDSGSTGRASGQPIQRGVTGGGTTTTLHICQTCGQRTAPDAVYCQSCHHSIASECSNCRLSLLPIQAICPRCQTPNPGAVKRRKPSPL